MRTHVFTFTWLVLAVETAVTCVPSGLAGQVIPQEVMGCYALEVGPWIPQELEIDAPRLTRLPEMFELDIEATWVAGVETAYAARTVSPATEAWPLYAWWPGAADSVIVSAGPFRLSSGLYLVLSRDAGILSGRAVAFREVPEPWRPEYGEAMIEATPISCS